MLAKSLKNICPDAQITTEWRSHISSLPSTTAYDDCNPLGCISVSALLGRVSLSESDLLASYSTGTIFHVSQRASEPLRVPVGVTRYMIDKNCRRIRFEEPQPTNGIMTGVLLAAETSSLRPRVQWLARPLNIVTSSVPAPDSTCYNLEGRVDFYYDLQCLGAVLRTSASPYIRA